MLCVHRGFLRSPCFFSASLAIVSRSVSICFSPWHTFWHSNRQNNILDDIFCCALPHTLSLCSHSTRFLLVFMLCARLGFHFGFMWFSFIFVNFFVVICNNYTFFELYFCVRAFFLLLLCRALDVFVRGCSSYYIALSIRLRFSACFISILFFCSIPPREIRSLFPFFSLSLPLMWTKLFAPFLCVDRETRAPRCWLPPYKPNQTKANSKCLLNRKKEHIAPSKCTNEHKCSSSTHNK